METEREIRRRTGGGNLGILPPVTTTLTDSISGDAGADLAAASDEYDRNFAARELGYRNQNHMDYYSRKLGAPIIGIMVHLIQLQHLMRKILDRRMSAR